MSRDHVASEMRFFMSYEIKSSNTNDDGGSMAYNVPAWFFMIKVTCVEQYGIVEADFNCKRPGTICVLGTRAFQTTPRKLSWK